MFGTVVRRSLGVLVLAAFIAGCHTSSHSAAGYTPVPSQTTLAQSNSTVAPDLSLSKTPGDKYFAIASPDMHGVTFAVWANGQPVNSTIAPGKAVDISQQMRGHANTIAVQWHRTSPNGSGTVTIGTRHSAVFTVRVTPHSPVKGQLSKTFIAPQVPVGR